VDAKARQALGEVRAQRIGALLLEVREQARVVLGHALERPARRTASAAG
jgi:hypothetical protein